MGYANKEIEKKFVVQDHTLNSAFNILNELFDAKTIEADESTDYYWHVPKSLKLRSDFMRVRQFNKSSGELTLKKAKKSNVSRIEIDLKANPKQSRNLLNQLLGKSAGTITKRYIVMVLDDIDTTISLYKVKNDARLFLEVEARTLRRVNSLIKSINRILKMDYESRSLYQIFLKRR